MRRWSRRRVCPCTRCSFGSRRPRWSHGEPRGVSGDPSLRWGSWGFDIIAGMILGAFGRLVLVLVVSAICGAGQTWRADNGNGTFTNPLFFDEFSDPDLIRVGAEFYLTGTTMHSMPGLPVLRSRDL